MRLHLIDAPNPNDTGYACWLRCGLTYEALNCIFIVIEFMCVSVSVVLPHTLPEGAIISDTLPSLGSSYRK